MSINTFAVILRNISLRGFSTSPIQFHNPSLKKKATHAISKLKKAKKPRKSNFGEAAYFKPSYHQIPYDPLLLDDISPQEMCDMMSKLTPEMKQVLTAAKISEEKEMNNYIQARLDARDTAMRLLRCKYPHAYICLIESIPPSRTGRKAKELDIIPGGICFYY